MKKNTFIYFLITIGLISIFSNGCKKDESSNVPSSATVKDIDGNIYHTATIGTQVWMVENLRTTKYNDGTDIPLGLTNAAWEYETIAPSYCWYNNDVSYAKNYGALYNWYAVNTKKLAPKGWHIPTKTEWATLISYLGGTNVAGVKLKESGLNNWEAPNNATNESGFTALPGGVRGWDHFYNFGVGGYWWAATEDTENLAFTIDVSYKDNRADQSNRDKIEGISVRCIKD